MKKILLWVLAALLLPVLIVAGWVFLSLRDLPDVSALKHYRPAAASEVLDRNGAVITPLLRPEVPRLGAQFYYIGNNRDPLYVSVDDILKSTKVVEVYSVKMGDALSGIAQHCYNNSDEANYMKIFNANRNKLKDPKEIFLTRN